MRPILLYAPRGPVPESLIERLTGIGAEVTIASSPGEAAATLRSTSPDLVLVVPPAGTADAAPLLPWIERHASPPPVFVLGGRETHALRPAALETISEETWTRATRDLTMGSGGASSAVLLPRVQLVTILQLWERIGEEGLCEATLRALMHALGAVRVSLFRWRTGEPQAELISSSLGSRVLGRLVDIARYPELRASAMRSGSVLVEEVDRDPLMDDATGFLSGVPIRSLVCQRLPGGSDLFLHAVRERDPFGLADVALVRVAARLLGRVVPGAMKETEARDRLLEMLRRILLDLPEPMALTDEGDRILAANRAFAGLSGFSLSAGGKMAALLDHAEALERTDSTGLGEVRHLVSASGERIPVEVLRVPLAAAEAAGWTIVVLRNLSRSVARRAREIALGKELTEEKARLSELESRSAEEAAARRRFWSAAAHELRTPLAILRTHLDVVLNDLSSEVGAKPLSLLKTAAESLDRFERLVADVVDGAVVDGSRDVTRSVELDPAAAVRNVVGARQSDAERRGLTLVADIGDGIPRVSGDRERVERILSNLVEHALKCAGRKEPEVRVTARKENGSVVLEVSDRGAPLGERVDRLFTDVDPGQGGGIPLVVAHAVAASMGAQLTAASSAEGNVRRLAWPVAAN
jgi:signal transduction histidine kinase